MRLVLLSSGQRADGTSVARILHGGTRAQPAAHAAADGDRAQPAAPTEPSVTPTQTAASDAATLPRT